MHGRSEWMGEVSRAARRGVGAPRTVARASAVSMLLDAVARSFCSEFVSFCSLVSVDFSELTSASSVSCVLDACSVFSASSACTFRSDSVVASKSALVVRASVRASVSSSCVNPREPGVGGRDESQGGGREGGCAATTSPRYVTQEGRVSAPRP